MGFFYSKNQIYRTDLQKLIDRELYFFISLFRDELKYFNQFDGFKLEGLIIASNKMKDLIKDFRFILNGYNENDYSHSSKIDIERLLSDMEEIEDYLNRIKTIRSSKEKVNYLMDICIIKIRMLYDSLNEFIFFEEQYMDAY